MDVVAAATALSAEAREADERRLLVLAGDRDRAYGALESVLEALPVGISGTTLISPDDRLRCERLEMTESDRLLGTTRSVVAVDAHDTLRPNSLGSVVGSVEGGGLLILLAPDLETWPERRDGFDESLAVPPFELEDVTGRFRERFIATLRAHRGVAIADVDRDRLLQNGLTEPAPRLPAEGPEIPDDSLFPAAAYDACLTADQADALVAFESLAEPGAVVCEADRGRGKSSALGLAAAGFAVRGEDVLVTAPVFRNAREVFDRAIVLLSDLVDTVERPEPGRIEVPEGGSVVFRPPEEAIKAVAAGEPDILFVDEAAAVPVRYLTELLVADRLAFATTVHGYEGAGRGFSVRFRNRLAESRHGVREISLAEPIRYAAGDPIEVWAFHALGLDARPAVPQVVADATPEAANYRRLSRVELAADETLLRETFGLLVLAHYRTEPDDLARLLDAPNLHARALTHDGHVVCVCLLASEGGLSPELRAGMYEGERIRGNMIPDVLTSQLRDEDAGRPRGLRVMRIATHHAARSRGLGSLLLREIREEFFDTTDWLGTGFGATAELISFWRENGYGTVHCSTTRNDASGEYSTIMLAPTSEEGRRLATRHAERFARRFSAVASDSLDDLEPDVARAVLRSVDADPPPLSLTDGEWRIVAGSAYGPALFDVDPGPFRTLVVHYFLDGMDLEVSAREERLLVARVLQAREWAAVSDLLGYHSAGQCMRALGDALCPLVDAYGDDVAHAVRDRFG